MKKNLIEDKKGYLTTTYLCFELKDCEITQFYALLNDIVKKKDLSIHIEFVNKILNE